MAGIFYLHLPHFYAIIIPQRRTTMPQIIPIRDLKNTTEISDLCHNSTEPIYITKNGYGDMVIMSIETYENTMKQIEMYQQILLSEKQIQEGRLKDANQSLQEMRKRYGI